MDIDDVKRQVLTDVLDGLGRDDDDDQPDGFDRVELERRFTYLDESEESLPVLVGDGASVVAWRTKANHDGPFQGIPPTGDDITITGCTYVLTGDNPTQFVRFVDWASVLAQLGVTFNTKPIVDDLEYAVGDPSNESHESGEAAG